MRTVERFLAIALSLRGGIGSEKEVDGELHVLKKAFKSRESTKVHTSGGGRVGLEEGLCVVNSLF